MTEPLHRITAEEWVDKFLAMPRERQLLVAVAVDKSVEQATFCYRNHRETSPSPLEALSGDERAAALAAFSAMANVVDVVLRFEDDAQGRRDALRELKTVCATGVELLTKEPTP